MRCLSFAPPFLLLVALAGCAPGAIATGPAPEPGPPPENVAAVTDAETPEPRTESESADFEYLRERQLIVPVAGAAPSAIEDSFNSPRDGGRTHRAIDILAPRGTPILAADDGRILRLSSNNLGGITIYAIDPGGRIVYYYAHLDHYHPGLSAGMTIAKGDTLGYVGTTGNAPKDTPHLHFQIMRWPQDGKYWYGDPIDPYPLLLAAARAAAAHAAVGAGGGKDQR